MLRLLSMGHRLFPILYVGGRPFGPAPIDYRIRVYEFPTESLAIALRYRPADRFSKVFPDSSMCFYRSVKCFRDRLK